VTRDFWRNKNYKGVIHINGKERIARILRHEPVDRIGIYEHFWNDTYAYYAECGKIKDGEDYDDHFNFDMSLCWPLNLMIDLDFKQETVSETEDTILLRDGNGALLRRHKLHDTTPEHVDFAIKTREDWEKVKDKLLNPDRRRINFEGYRKVKAAADKAGRFLLLSGVNVFESIHPICGHEYLLMGMAMDPDWVLDMAKTYTDLILSLQEILFEEEGQPDGIWYYEDMGFKERPFFSPNMYKELIYPSHKRTFDHAHERGMPVIVHSCGFVEPLLPHMVDAGMDCLQVIEIKAGMDLLRIYEQYGEKIALMGGIDVRTLYSNDKKIIDAELAVKIPIVKQGFGYIAHSDHSIPKTVEYDTFMYYLGEVRRLGAYK
jgi:uroporphyrinogen decarboxylase